MWTKKIDEVQMKEKEGRMDGEKRKKKETNLVTIIKKMGLTLTQPLQTKTNTIILTSQNTTIQSYIS